jgi:hypothetical protein
MENLIERVKDHWTSYLVKFPFDWGVTLTFKYPVKKEHAKIKLKAWTRKLCKEERLQIGYIAVINEINRIHLHLLALGRNRHGKTLLDVPVDKWKKKWNAHSKIRPVEEIERASSYLSRNLVVKNEDLSDVWIYNSKLLKKLRFKEDLAKLNDITSWDLNKSHSDTNADKKQIRSQMTELMNSFKDTKEE